MLSKLSSNDRLALLAGALVESTALLALGDAWGMVMVISFLAGLGAVAVILLPHLEPDMKLPAGKGVSILALGVAAIIGTGISTLQNLTFISEELVDPETLIFVAGLVFAIILAYAGWVAFQAESGAKPASATPAAPAGPSGATPPPPPPAPEA